MITLVRCLLVAVLVWPQPTSGQASSGIAPVDSASVARTAWASASRALREQNLADARREMERAASAWPQQPAYQWARAVLAARSGDTVALKAALVAYADMGLGRDLRADSAMARAVTAPAFVDLERRHEVNRKPIERSMVRATLPDSSLWPEGIDIDGRNGRIYLTSVRHRTVVEWSPGGGVRDVMPRGQSGIGAMLAVRVDTARGVLWATTSGIAAMEGYQPADSAIAALLCIRIRDGAVVQRVDLSPGQHVLGDVALASNGDVLFTDSMSPALYWLRAGAKTPVRIVSPLMRSPQGIALRGDGRVAYVADYSHGLLRVDLESRAVRWLGPAPGGTALGLDGIAWHRGGIVAIQNGVTPARVARFDLDEAGERIVRSTVLDQNVGIADEPTIGAIVGDEFIYVANSQWSKRDDRGDPLPGALLRGPVVLALRLF